MKVSETSIRLDVVLLFLIPISYFVPSLSFMGHIGLWATAVFTWIAAIILMVRYNAFVKMLREKGINDDTVKKLKFKPSYIVTYAIIVIGGIMIEAQFATAMLVGSFIAFHLILRDAKRDARDHGA